MDETSRTTGLRYSVGAHHRVWWFWLPLILGVLCLLLDAALIPVAGLLGVFAGALALLLLIWAAVSHWVIARGRRWLEYDDAHVRIIDRSGTCEFRYEHVTDLADYQILHHAAGRLTGISRVRRLWVEMPSGARTFLISNRVDSDGGDPLGELFDRISDQLVEKGADVLAARKCVEGDRWRLDEKSLVIENGKEPLSLPWESLAAMESVGQELRIWQSGHPRAVVKLPLSGRNTWMLPRLIPLRSDVVRASGRPNGQPAPGHPLGRILFERTAGPVVPLLFAVLGIAIAAVGLASVVWSARNAEVIGVVLGALLTLTGAILLVCSVRVRRVRFSCCEHGLERVTLSSRQILKFSEIDVFSFESHRNRSHGRYTGTTYTLVFADRSAEQGRGIFFSTTVHNIDEELELLRDRVSENIARRLAAAFARDGCVQWTTELRFHEDVLEFSRPRRFLSAPRLTLIPYDAITTFQVRDGRFHVWTNYQERAVVNVRTSSANFYPGLLLLEGLVNTHVREPVHEWFPPASVP